MFTRLSFTKRKKKIHIKFSLKKKENINRKTNALITSNLPGNKKKKK